MPERTEPTDEEILAGMRSATPEALGRLRAALADDRDAEPGSLVEWRGGQPTGEPNTWSMPSAVDDERVHRLTGALQDVGAFVVFGWVDRPPARSANDPAAVRAAPLPDLARFVTTIVRSERFAEGAIEVAMTAGTLPLIAERVLAEVPGLALTPPR